MKYYRLSAYITYDQTFGSSENKEISLYCKNIKVNKVLKLNINDYYRVIVKKIDNENKSFDQ